MIWGDRRVIRIDMGWYGVIWGDGIPPPHPWVPPTRHMWHSHGLGGGRWGRLWGFTGGYGAIWGDVGRYRVIWG